ncbi:MAG: hypothetical protein OEZ29_08680 [Candidatus Bathyarchaeota archaeon]|nr:hypothetical protein [Candidatus Bathyarchaeota archaeon]
MPEARHVNLDDPEAVKGYIVSQARWSNAYKQGVAYAYHSYVKVNGLQWNLPHFRIEDKLPRIPTEENAGIKRYTKKQRDPNYTALN